MRQMSMPGHRARRLLPKTTAATALAVALLFAGSISSASATCPDEGNTPSQLTIQAARDAVLCLINGRRTDYGLGSVEVNNRLQRAAQRHSKAMKVRKFFGHIGDGSPVSRMRSSGFMAGASSWRVAEDLSWGSGDLGSPKSAVEAWMASTSHREALLGGFPHVGIGVAMGSPLRGYGRNAAIYTADFGYRR